MNVCPGSGTYIQSTLQEKLIFLHHSVRVVFHAVGQPVAILLVDWVPLAQGCFLRALRPGSRSPLDNDVTVDDYPPAACGVYWGKRAPSVFKTSTDASNCLQTRTL